MVRIAIDQFGLRPIYHNSTPSSLLNESSLSHSRKREMLAQWMLAQWMSLRGLFIGMHSLVEGDSWMLSLTCGFYQHLVSNFRRSSFLAVASLCSMICGQEFSHCQSNAALAVRSLDDVLTWMITMDDNNPFSKASNLVFEAPDFAHIRTEHFLPAFEAGMREQLEEIQQIADQSSEPTFENTLVAMERTGQTLRRVSAVFFNLASTDATEEMQKVEEVIAPKLAAHSDNILLNPKLFVRVESLWNRRDKLGLNEEQSRLLKEHFESFVRAGARLEPEQQETIRRINEELSTLTTQFQNNLLSASKERAVIIDQIVDLDGMSDAEIGGAKEAAKERGFDGKYLISLTNTTRQPVLTQLTNREVRRKVWEASANRCLGENGEVDNRPLVLKIARLRAERARILGYANHADYTLENQMAKETMAALTMLKDLVPQVRKRAEEEAAKIQALMKADGIEDEVRPWDWEYYAERVRKQEYEVDENQLKPYFELDSVLKNGVFFTMNRLYGVQFTERFDLPVYHPTVRVFDVTDSNGDPMGLFYADYFHRDGKRGGAWMDAFVSQSRLLHQRPVIVNVLNIPKPAEGEPALVSFDNVTTLFHEMGHAVHGLFSSVEYPTLSGTSVPRDFVEFPSTFHEDWAIEPSVLSNYAMHYKTGEPIPSELLEKAIRANKFNKGFETLEYLAAALLDLAWHSLTPEEIPNDVKAFESASLAKFGVDYGPVPPRYRTCYFAHVWSGGYSAGYYAYLWSEVLAADAFAHMMRLGGLTSENGEAYKNKILSRGGSREVMDQYIDFRGQKPSVDALLIRRGLRENN